MQQFTNKYSILYAFFIIANYLGATSVILGPTLMSSTFPTDAKYPFQVDSKPLKIIIYVHQSFTGYQIAAAMSLDCLVGFFLWFIIARCELLSREFRNARNDKEIILCIRKHQSLLRYLIFSFAYILHILYDIKLIVHNLHSSKDKEGYILPLHFNAEDRVFLLSSILSNSINY